MPSRDRVAEHRIGQLRLGSAGIGSGRIPSPPATAPFLPLSAAGFTATCEFPGATCEFPGAGEAFPATSARNPPDVTDPVPRTERSELPIEETDSCNPANGLSIPARMFPPPVPAPLPPGSSSKTPLTSDSTLSRRRCSSPSHRPAWRTIDGSLSGPKTKSANIRTTDILGRLRSNTIRVYRRGPPARSHRPRRSECGPAATPA